MASKRDKTTGLPLPSPVTPATQICVTLSIPNAPEYIQAFRGVLADLGKNWTWKQTVGQSDAPAREAAELWRKWLMTITYSDDCEDVMSCFDVANCIDDNPLTQDAIARQLASNPLIKQIVTEQARLGSVMLPGQLGLSLTSGASCNKDNLFGSITAIVEQLNTNNIDFLEKFEVISNVIERVGALIAAVPVFETLPVDDAVAFVDTLLGEIKENYEAQYTTMLKDTYRCDLFCAALEREGCEVTFDILIKYYEDRLGASFTNEAMFVQMVAFFVSGAWAGTQVVDAITLAQLVIWREASNFLGLSLRSLQTVGLLGANDSDPDWEILCEDCSQDCAFPYPASVNFLYGNVISVTNDIYTVASQIDENGNNVVTWPNQAYGLPRTYQVEFFSLEYLSGEEYILRVYAEATVPGSAIINTQTDPGPLNFPYCVSYFQIYSGPSHPFTVKIGFKS